MDTQEEWKRGIPFFDKLLLLFIFYHRGMDIFDNIAYYNATFKPDFIITLLVA